MNRTAAKEALNVPNADALVTFEDGSVIFYSMPTGIEVVASSKVVIENLLKNQKFIENKVWEFQKEKKADIESRRGKIIKIYIKNDKGLCQK